jgi:hypothetical protein
MQPDSVGIAGGEERKLNSSVTTLPTQMFQCEIVPSLWAPQKVLNALEKRKISFVPAEILTTIPLRA